MADSVVSNPALPSTALPEGRDHWHHFRNERGDGVLRCWRCLMTMTEFQESEAKKDTV